MRADLTETFQMKFLIMVDSLSTFFFELVIYCQDKFKKPSLLNN